MVIKFVNGIATSDDKNILNDAGILYNMLGYSLDSQEQGELNALDSMHLTWEERHEYGKMIHEKYDKERKELDKRTDEYRRKQNKTKS